MRPLSARRVACPRCGRGWDATLSRCGWCGALAGPERCRLHAMSVASWACAVCGRRLCADCRRGGRHAALCLEHGEIPLVQGWAEVARAEDEVRGEMLAGAVRAAGLDAQLLSQKDYAHVVGLGGLAIVRVLVPAHQWREARVALAEGGSGETRFS